MKRTAISVGTQPNQEPSVSNHEWTMRRVAEIIYSATHWSYRADQSLNWTKHYLGRKIGTVDNTLSHIVEDGEKYRQNYDFCAPDESWAMIHPGLFVKGSQETETLEFKEIHIVEKSGYIDRVKDEYVYGQVKWGDFNGGWSIFGFEGYDRWQVREWTEKPMDIFISSGSTLAE